jgi:hypothetical protein
MPFGAGLFDCFISEVREQNPQHKCLPYSVFVSYQYLLGYFSLPNRTQTRPRYHLTGRTELRLVAAIDKPVFSWADL